MINLNNLPNQPGVYKFLNKKEQIIYIGKAKNIKKRVSQYFKIGSHKSEYFKSLIFDVSYIITKSENEALLLEINLIKTHKPKFNIIFKDDKTYPYICVLEKNGNLVVEVRRAKLARLKNCFGPFPAGSKSFKTTRMIQELYKLKKCKKQNESRCVYNQLRQCLHLKGRAKEEYNMQVKKSIISFFKGQDQEIKKFVINKMMHFAKLEEYESAQKYKEMLKRFGTFQEKQTIYSKQLENADYIGWDFIKEILAVFVVHVRQGKIINTFSKKYDVVGKKTEAIFNFVISFYDTNPIPDFLYLDNKAKQDFEKALKITIKNPKIGQKRKLLDMANVNAQKLITSVMSAQNKKEVFEEKWLELGKFVGIHDLHNIEIYDASHISGDSYVGAKVEFEYGEYNSNKTRKYNLDKLTSANDYLGIEIMLKKRFRNEKNIPDLIIVDGGLGQINTAKKILFNLGIKCKLIGLIKNKKHKTETLILEDGHKTPIKNVSFKLILTIMQTKVHQVAIDYHRQKRIKKTIKK